LGTVSPCRFLLNLPDFPYKNIPEYTLKFTLTSKLKLGFLGNYGVYQETLGEDIRGKREKGWMYKEIAKDLTERGYMSARGRVLKANHVERMYKKLLEKREWEGERDIGIRDVRIVYRD
jgi:hypothetical protein